MGRDRPHGDARRADEHETVRTTKTLRCPVRETLIRTAPRDRAPHCGGKLFRQRQPMFGESDESKLHGSSPFRKPVENAGSYSLLRS